MDADFNKMLQLVNDVLHDAPYTRDEVCKVLEISDEELADTLLSKNTQERKYSFNFSRSALK